MLRKAAEYKKKVVNEPARLMTDPASPGQSTSASPRRADAGQPPNNSSSRPVASPAAMASEFADARTLQAPQSSSRHSQSSTLYRGASKPLANNSESMLDAIMATGSQHAGGENDRKGSAAMSQRSDDEEIRSTRQARMNAMGLTGRPSSTWANEANDRVSSASDSATDTEEGPPTVVGAEFEGLGSAGKPRNQGLSAEQFTLQKEDEQRLAGAEIISFQRDYQPAVSTWGVFDRPKDISKAFGGGRNLTAEDSKMSAEEQERYDQELRKKLAAYRKTSGLVGSPEDVLKCETLTGEGIVLMRRGDVQQALELFEKAAVILSPKTEAGGMALLQQAIALDSLGQHDPALKLYRRLLGHQSAYVSKTARTMSFGFRAGEFLKADTISYAVSKEEYDPLFTALNGKFGWDTVYTPTQQDKEEAAGSNAVLTAIVTILMISPFAVLIAAIVS